MNFEKYYQARDVVVDFLRKDLLGPVKPDEIITDTMPSIYYAAGILFPQGMLMSQTEQEKDDLENETDSSEQQMSMCYATYPSSMAISFTVAADIASLAVEVDYAWYVPREKDAEKSRAKKREEWQRFAGQWHGRLDIANDKQMIDPVKIQDHLELRLYVQKRYDDGSRTLTAALVNCRKHDKMDDMPTDNKSAFFQPQIRVRNAEACLSAFVAKKLRVSMSQDKEILNLEMLYQHNQEFAVGHGCSAGWIADGERASEVYTEFIPSHELFQMKPAADAVSDAKSFHYLGWQAKEKVIASLKSIVANYGDWINRQCARANGMPERYKAVAEENTNNCRESLERIDEGIRMLERCPDAFLAFQLANRAMHAMNEQRYGAAEAAKRSWYPFQLAFILQELSSIHAPDHKYRQIVDLLWFPTGGGKTEAYLGLTAFTVFLRRMRSFQGNRSGGGVTVLMRYTLRLLTLDQFERAAALICACELVRRERPDELGDEEISAGLWVGSGLTPNKRNDARTALNKIKNNGIASLDKEEANPCQILKCPWCGESIYPRDYSIDSTKMTITCPNDHCQFHYGLPVYLIDEDIYDHGPSLVVGTVDKYARMTWEPRTGRLFGLGSPWSPPELIIQDELHLIAGPLGTIAGLYEVAVDNLCRKDGIGPKVIASTATIRNAKGQILSLYGRDFRQFPAQGTDIRDSYFALVSDRNEKPSRLYLGLLTPGTSGNTQLIRVYSILIFATRYLKELGYQDEVVDSFWTLTGYFNSLKQLGGAVINVIDDVDGRLKYLHGTKFSGLFATEPSFVKNGLLFDELTSRKDNSEIGLTRERLKIAYPSADAFDLILASNMLSVGLDIGRLGLMIVRGQPKTNSEYIQATSRVGRQTPGLVITMYDASRSRDRSHYEQFTAYHSSLYKYVEATSLTPFAERARDRALHAVLIILCRHLVPGLGDNDQAGNVAGHRTEVEQQIEKILDRVNVVDDSEYQATQESLEQILAQWESIASSALVYQNYYKIQGAPLLTDRFDRDDRPPFATLNAMRNVDVESEVVLEV